MNETYSSAMRTRADGSRTRYRTSTGSPSTIETRSLLRFDSHQRGAARGRTAGRLAVTLLDVPPALPSSRTGANEAIGGGRTHLGAVHRMERGARAPRA